MEFISNAIGEKNHLATLKELIEWSEKCVLCTSYINNKGIKLLMPVIENGILERNLDITIYSNGESGFTKPKACRTIESIPQIKHILVQDNIRLHAKIYCFEKGNLYKTVIGSANLTEDGLVHNREFSTLVIGQVNDQQYHNMESLFSKLLVSA
jgi:HKD family nuclease